MWCIEWSLYLIHEDVKTAIFPYCGTKYLSRRPFKEKDELDYIDLQNIFGDLAKVGKNTLP